ncbi:phytoene desaturase family protein [Streptomyces sp. NPDC058701]|uniref:phytoene desaturase family protein n=1 Tax=Streptomyces sp. NPDC058701 TaxID=3346608 RepID=UPI00365C1BBD
MTIRIVQGTADHVVVIGAGLAGLSTALHLSGAGRSVTVLEQGGEPGGKAGVFRQDGYTLDNGPTVLTMPELIRQAFAAVGEEMEQHLTLLPVSPAYRAHYSDGSSLDVLTDTHAMAAEIERVCGAAEAVGYRRLVAFLKRLYACEYDNFINRNTDGPLDLALPELARLASYGAFRSMEGKVRQYLKDPRTIRLFSFQALYAGVAPHHARALYTIISYMDTVSGVFFPEGGMHALPRAMADAAVAHGVKIKYHTAVELIETTLGGRARAVLTSSGARIPAEAVVIASEPSVALPRLLGRAPRRLRRLRYSPSCFLWLAGSPPQPATDGRAPAHHNIHFGRTWRRGCQEVIDRGVLMTDPSFMVNVPTVTDSSLAPEGCHSHSVLFLAPNLIAGRVDWETTAPRYRDEIRKIVWRNGYTALAEDPRAEHVITPADWLRRGCPAGTPFSAAHTFRQTWPFRTPNLAGENIVLAGAGTHPGVGVPMALISGRLAAERVTGPVRTARRRPLGAG